MRMRSFTLPVLLAAAWAVPAGAQAIRPGQTLRGSLQTSDPRMQDGSHYDIWDLTGRPGEQVTVTLRSGDFDTYLGVASGTGENTNMEATDDDGGGGTDSRVQVSLPANGQLRILATSLQADQTGNYTLAVESNGGGNSGGGGNGGGGLGGWGVGSSGGDAGGGAVPGKGPKGGGGSSGGGSTGGGGGSTGGGPGVASSLRTQMDSVVSLMRNQGLRPLAQAQGGSLRQGTTSDLFFQLPSTGGLVVVGVCDGQCTDLDLAIFPPNGTDALGLDVEDDDVPLVVLENGISAGTYRVRVAMPACSGTCAFGVSVFGR